MRCHRLKPIISIYHIILHDTCGLQLGKARKQVKPHPPNSISSIAPCTSFWCFIRQLLTYAPFCRAQLFSISYIRALHFTYDTLSLTISFMILPMRIAMSPVTAEGDTENPSRVLPTKACFSAYGDARTFCVTLCIPRPYLQVLQVLRHVLSFTSISGRTSTCCRVKSVPSSSLSLQVL